jgi:4-amino-4-deoxy-L-arabinose transferase-like glycosyltransferase
MIPSKWPRELRVILSILVVALAVRVYQMGWGLPFVYEEAIPLKRAWTMWGWGTSTGADLNPHFFNYPSLTIYLHFVAQGLLYLAMRLGGLVTSGGDYHARYLVDPTPVYYVGRLMSVLFGVATVLLTYPVGRRCFGRGAAVSAAALVAVNTFHISRSQLVEVDLPLTFFAMLVLWLLLRLTEQPTLGNYAVAGAMIGLATSTKYTGAMLVLPLVAADIFARARGARKPCGWYVALAVLVAAAVFLLTSPYVVLDAGTFADHIATERQHMHVGHFGLSGSSSSIFYARSLAGGLMGWPAAVLALAGLVYLAIVRRRGTALILAAFVVPYLLAVCTWSMRADRYLLPVLPVLVLFATAVVEKALGTPPVSRWSDRVRVVTGAALTLVLAAPVAAHYPAYVRSTRTDARTAATRWIEANIPAGSYLVVEPYGPELFGPQKISQLSPEVRKKVLELKKNSPNYAVLPMPMFQVAPERSQVFYDHSLYENADYIVTTGAVRSRYTGEPVRFRRQIAFYDSLEIGYTKIAEFSPAKGGGSLVTVYKNPRHELPFDKRKEVAPPRKLRHEGLPPTGSEELFYFNVGLNYEVFLYLNGAIAAYDMAFLYPIDRPSSYKNLVLRKTLCLMILERREEALGFLEKMAAKAPTPGVRAQLRDLRHALAEGKEPADR